MEHLITETDDPPLTVTDEPYTPKPLTQAIGFALIGIIIGLALYGGAQIVKDILA